jgi:hypothetical protein
MTERLERAAKELDLEIQLDPWIRLKRGDSVRAHALFPHLGGPGGMAVFSLGQSKDLLTEESTDGIGFAFLSEPHRSEGFDIDAWLEVFTDWGWSGSPEIRPTWMLSSDDE